MVFTEQYNTNLTKAQIEESLENLLKEIRGHRATPIRDEALRMADSAALSGLTSADVSVKRQGAGLTPADTTIILTFATKVSYDLWKHVLLPRIRQRWGEESLKALTGNKADGNNQEHAE